MKVTVQTPMGEFITDITGKTRSDVGSELLSLMCQDGIAMFKDVDGKQVHFLHSEALKKCGFSIDISEIKDYT